ncbi:MAG: tetratricopeptide repeat protein, partial [Candidatus Heimdallarchaeota archaeon]
MDTRDRLKAAISHQSDLNPNDRLQKGTIVVLGEELKEQQELEKLLTLKIDISAKGPLSWIKGKKKAQKKTAFIKSKLVATKQIAFQIASLSCYLTQKMKATDEYKALLKQIEHPYIEMFLTYFNENPTNYKEIRETVEQLSQVIEKRNDFTLELKAYVVALRTWVYGQQGDIAVLKEGYRYIKKRLPQVDNIIESRGLEDASTNCIWWMLHSGVEANIEEMIDFVEPFVLKNRIYQSYTDFLNLKGAIVSYFGKNEEGIICFENLMNEYENVHDNYRLSIAIGNLAEVYFETGQILKAKDMMERAISLYKESTGEWPYLYLTEMGNIYYVVGDKRAEESFLHAYEIQRKE